MITEDALGEILRQAMGDGIDYADVFISRKETKTVFADNRKLEKVYGGFEEGAGIRVVRGRYTGYLYTNDISLPSLLRLAKEAKNTAGAKGDGQAFPLHHRKIRGAAPGGNLSVYGNLIRDAGVYAWDRAPELKQVSLSLADVK